ncbi:MAG TPA: response regulator transcription factor [Acidimicrobiales bacterium]|nr:response regulator transcription factor [Acidimicrobiales bacterium]
MAGPQQSVPVAILGRPGMARDLMRHVLAGAGFPLVDAEELPAHPGPVVAVLVEPGVGDWAAASRPGTAIVLVADRPAADHALVEAVLRGVDAILHTDATTQEIVDAVRTVGQGGTVLDPRSTRSLADILRACHRKGQRVGTRLTGRERDILTSIDRGDSVKQTARALGIATKTVENLQTRLFRKLGVRNRAQAVGRAHSLGLLGDATAGQPTTAEEPEQVAPGGLR